MKSIDSILKASLSPDFSPSKELNNKILDSCTEEKTAARKKHIFFKSPFVAACVILCCSLTVFAAINFLSPSQVAKIKGDKALAEAFRSEDAVFINETKQSGGYDVTLLGMISGKGLTDNVIIRNGDVIDDRTYCVVAIANSDGTLFKDSMTVPTFYVSPFIQGYEPQLNNIQTILDGRYFECVSDGVLYRIIECDSIEKYTDRIVYIGVTDTTFYNIETFNYNSTDGTMEVNKDYDGLSVLFELPLNSSK